MSAYKKRRAKVNLFWFNQRKTAEIQYQNEGSHYDGMDDMMRQCGYPQSEEEIYRILGLSEFYEKDMKKMKRR